MSSAEMPQINSTGASPEMYVPAPTLLQECFTYIGVDAGQLRATLLSHDEKRGVLALLLGADHHLLDGASYVRVDTFAAKEP